MPEAELERNGVVVCRQIASRSTLTIGRNDDSDLIIPIDWSECSRVQAQLWWLEGAWWLRDGTTDRPSINGTYLPDGTPAGQGLPLTAGPNLSFVIGRGPLAIAVTLRGLGHGEQPATAADVRDAVSGVLPPLRPEQGGQVVRIGRSPDCDVVLDDPSVSRLHVVLKPHADGSATVEDWSRNGIYLNGVRASRLSRIESGTILHIGRARYVWQSGTLLPATDSLHYGLHVRQLMLKGRLQDISLSINGGELVALVGGSGAGKSSLLTTMAGHIRTYHGMVAVAGEDLRSSINALRPQMGFVPQDDILHEELTVEEVLRFAARLRLPDQEAQEQAVERVLDVLEIAHRRLARVRQLSGGQRKRVSIGMELVADPRLLFLDEPTSGLDPGLDRRMMHLLRQLADKGQTVVLVTHATANVTLCDQVVFLARGGHLCFAGPPRQCLDHFDVGDDFTAVYEHLDGDDEHIQKWSQKFRSSPHAVLPSINPQGVGTRRTGSIRTPFVSLSDVSRFFSQLRTLAHRELLITLRDRVTLGLNLLTGPFAILLLAFAVQDRGVFTVPTAQITAESLPLAIKVVFLITCACLWSGISSQVTGVARERPIYERERGFDLIPAAYLSSKMLQMLMLGLVQAVLISLTVALLFDLPGSLSIGDPLLGYGLSALLTILASGSLALLVSTLVRDQRQASSTSPLLLMPQLILSGVLFPIEQLAFLFPFVASRWSVKLFGAFSSLSSLSLNVEIPGLEPLDITPYVTTSGNVRESLGVLLTQWFCFGLLALISLSRRRGL
jgi:ABC-type multidrug transport system ATPase subunit/pSer/pThr/pTyr-binding forkhead associated (FHA) protein/ABC-type multidrug transport system permease subunit